MSCSNRDNLSPFALLTPEDTRRMDRSMASILGDVMERAGMMAARIIRQYVRPCRVLVACGPGNNGGDGYVLARHLQAYGWSVCVAAYQAPREGGLAAAAAGQWRGPMVAFSEAEAQRADLVIDAVFGAGMNKALPVEVERFFAAAQKLIALDVPSVVDGQTGCLMGKMPACSMTIALIRKRPGHVLQPGSSMCGRVVCADLAVPESILEQVVPRLWENTPHLWSIPQQDVGDHKYARGVVSVCGGKDMPGAALLAAEAARHVGAGMLRLVVSEDAVNKYRFASPALIIDTQPLDQGLSDIRRKVWICGPGLSEHEVSRTLPLLLAAEKSVLADAGALSWAAGAPEKVKGVSVITPHAGEFSKLFGNLPAGKLEAVKQAARFLGAVVVLKGADTLIAAPDGRVAINTHASSALAIAGSGDVLSGVIATFLAAGMSPWDAAAAGVWVHGDAAMKASAAKGNWITVEDLYGALGRARCAAGFEGK